MTAYVIVDFYHFHDHFNNNRNLMYFSGSEFHNKLLAMSGIFKTKKLVSIERKINILEEIGNKYFLEQNLNFSAFNQT